MPIPPFFSIDKTTYGNLLMTRRFPVSSVIPCHKKIIVIFNRDSMRCIPIQFSDSAEYLMIILVIDLNKGIALFCHCYHDNSLAEQSVRLDACTAENGLQNLERQFDNEPQNLEWQQQQCLHFFSPCPWLSSQKKKEGAIFFRVSREALRKPWEEHERKCAHSWTHSALRWLSQWNFSGFSWVNQSVERLNLPTIIALFLRLCGEKWSRHIQGFLACGQDFPSPHKYMPLWNKNLTQKNEIIDWPIFSRAAGATTKTAAVTNRTYGAIESFPSAFGLTLRVAIASVIDSPLRVSSSSADTKRRVAATRRLTKFWNGV